MRNTRGEIAVAVARPNYALAIYAAGCNRHSCARRAIPSSFPARSRNGRLALRLSLRGPFDRFLFRASVTQICLALASRAGSGKCKANAEQCLHE